MDRVEEKSSPLNYDTYQDVEQTVAAGIPEIMIDLIETYLTDSQHQFQILSTAIETGAFDQITRSAHTMKSTSATFGAESLADIFAQIEHQARRKDSSLIAPLLARAHAQFTVVARALHVEQDRLHHDLQQLSNCD